MTTTSPTQQPTFVAYEYLTLQVPRTLEPVYKDSFNNFGWQFEDYSPNLGNPASVNLKLKRDRRLKNRPVILELQRKCHTALENITRLEKSKTTAAITAATAFGLVDCSLIAGAVFAVLAESWVLMGVLQVLGLAACLGGYLSYNKVQSSRSARVAPLIDREYETVYETTEQAHIILQPTDLR